MAACSQGIEATPRKTDQRSAKKLTDYISLLFFAKLLTFRKVEKAKWKMFNLVHLLPFSSSLLCITQKLYGVYKYYTFQRCIFTSI